MYRNRMLFFCLLVLFALQATAQHKQALSIQKNGNKPLNVIFILSDDHRYDFMGFTGKVPWLKTPNMDKMAQRRRVDKKCIRYYIAMLAKPR